MASPKVHRLVVDVLYRFWWGWLRRWSEHRMCDTWAIEEGSEGAESVNGWWMSATRPMVGAWRRRGPVTSPPLTLSLPEKYTLFKMSLRGIYYNTSPSYQLFEYSPSHWLFLGLFCVNSSLIRLISNHCIEPSNSIHNANEPFPWKFRCKQKKKKLEFCSRFPFEVEVIRYHV